MGYTLGYSGQFHLLIAGLMAILGAYTSDVTNQIFAAILIILNVIIACLDIEKTQPEIPEQTREDFYGYDRI